MSLQEHTFEHAAMATTFVLRIHHERAVYARQAAMEAFRLCDQLESELSRFVESSSVSRLNAAACETEVPLHPDAYLCLRQALHMADLTDGLFDIGFRSRGTPGAGGYSAPLRLSDESVSALPLRPAPDIDLGGIGKGYAIDRMADLLRELSVGSALIMGGYSTLLALGNPPGQPGWPIRLAGADGMERFLPSGWSVSASGFEVRGDHVLDPGTGERPTELVRAWSVASSAAVSDALSTAFLVMGPDQTRQFVKSWPECGAILQFPNQPAEFAGLAAKLL